MAGLYIHIPFCKQACHYCDFHFSTNQELISELSHALASELRLQKDYLGNELISTIYFGGGTPSLLSVKEFEFIFNSIHSLFRVQLNPEVTLEANPDDLSAPKLNALKQLGFNRLSIGIQSFDDAILKFLNRAHDGQSGLRSIQLAHQSGFENISLDLIYSIPGQDQSAWLKNMQLATGLSPEHVSAYSLTIEEKTVFGRLHQKGKLQAVDEESSARQFEMLMDHMEGAGYEHYEISNFCKPNCYSQHNRSYWQQVNYLGVGPSAHSFNGLSRQFNISNNHLYVNAIRQGKVPCEVELLTRANQVNEFIFTSLRTQWGCDLKKLSQKFSCDLPSEKSQYLSFLLLNNFASLEDNVLRLTRSGKLLADKISSELFIEDSK